MTSIRCRNSVKLTLTFFDPPDSNFDPPDSNLDPDSELSRSDDEDREEIEVDSIERINPFSQNLKKQKKLKINTVKP
jgi:hypothetical protein